MYGFSRAIYRELADEIIEDPHSARRCTNHERVLRECEAAVARLATDRQYFARPARTLFREIRLYFPMSSQLRVLQVVEHYVALADEFLRRLPKKRIRRQRHSTPVSRQHAQGITVPAHALAPQRLLPIPPAPRRY